MDSEQRIKEIRAYISIACGVVVFAVLIYHNVVGHLTIEQLFTWLFTLGGGGALTNGIAMRLQNRANGNGNGAHH